MHNNTVIIVRFYVHNCRFLHHNFMAFKNDLKTFFASLNRLENRSTLSFLCHVFTDSPVNLIYFLKILSSLNQVFQRRRETPSANVHLILIKIKEVTGFCQIKFHSTNITDNNFEVMIVSGLSQMAFKLFSWPLLQLRWVDPDTLY